MKEPRPALSSNALKALRFIEERAMDGYTLRSKTGLNEKDLSEAIEELAGQKLVNVDGDVPRSIYEAFFSVPTRQKSYVRYILEFGTPSP